MTPQQHAAKHAVTVCSIVSFSLPPCIRPLYTPVSNYALETSVEITGSDGEVALVPVSAKAPFYLVIRDAWQPEYKGENVGNQQMMVLAERIAHDVVQDYTERIPGWASDRYPGVFVCEGKIATQEELDRAVVRHDKWCADAVALADATFKREGNARNVRSLAREAANHLKLDRVWLYEVKSSDTKTCLECGEPIKATANTCKHCGSKGLLAREAKPLPPAIPSPASKEPRLVETHA